MTQNVQVTKRTAFSALREELGLTIDDVASNVGVSPRTVYRWERGEIRPKKLVIDLLQRHAKQNKSDPYQDGAGFTFIDLFAGIGGFRRGFESVGGACVFSSEWDAACQRTYRANSKTNHPMAGDIRDVSSAFIPQHDVLLAGFPCQPFSIAGVSKKNALGQPHGFHCETQGTLFFEVARILETHRPAAFVLENVKNLLSHDKGKTISVIKKTLEQDLGYFTDMRLINARSFLPQNRERVFIVGFREDVGFRFEDCPVPVTTSGPRLGSILHSEDGTEREDMPYTCGPDAKVNSKYTLSPRLWEYLQAYAAKHRAKGNGFGFGLFGPDDVARTLSARYYKDGSEILIRQKRRRPRRLTPRECARIMGFDNGQGTPFLIPVSDTQAYKQFGNAVAVPVVREVARTMLPFIKQLTPSNIERTEALLSYR